MLFLYGYLPVFFDETIPVILLSDQYFSVQSYYESFPMNPLIPDYFVMSVCKKIKNKKIFLLKKISKQKEKAKDKKEKEKN